MADPRDADFDALVRELQDSAVDTARIAQLEELLRPASAVGGAGLGSTVRVADDKGRTTEYELIGRRSEDSERHEVTLASPVGRALWGARPGDVVQVSLPNGRDHALRVIDVCHPEGIARAA